MRDIRTVVSDAQSLVGLATAVSTSSVKIITGNAPPLVGVGRDLGRGEELFFRVAVTQAFDGAVASLSISVIQATDEALTTGIVVLGTSVVTLSGLFLGNEFDVRIPSLTENNVVGVPFLGLRYTPAVVPTTGAVSAWVPFGDSPGKQGRLRSNYTGPVG